VGHTGPTDVGLRSISTLTTVLAHQLLSELNSLMVLRWSETPTIDDTSFDTFEYTSEGLTRTGHGRETLGQTSGHHQTPPTGIPSFRNIHQLLGQLARCEQESSVETHRERRAGSLVIVHFRAHDLGCPHEATVASRDNARRAVPENAPFLPIPKILHASRLVNPFQVLEVTFSCQLGPNILLTTWLPTLPHERLSHIN
jgi:hypothetical protein